MNRNSQNTSEAVTDQPERALSCAAREVIMRKCLALFPLWLCGSVAILFTGCVSAHKKGRTIHERWDYQIVQSSGYGPVALPICHEIWRDEWTGGGRALLSDPKASQLLSIHTNQTALGGSSTLSIGDVSSQVSTNGIIAVGNAGGQIIQATGAAVGQLFNKSVTGTPLK
jgi:hypothetical protein